MLIAAIARLGDDARDLEYLIWKLDAAAFTRVINLLEDSIAGQEISTPFATFAAWCAWCRLLAIACDAAQDTARTLVAADFFRALAPTPATQAFGWYSWASRLTWGGDDFGLVKADSVNIEPAARITFMLGHFYLNDHCALHSSFQQATLKIETIFISTDVDERAFEVAGVFSERGWPMGMETLDLS